MRSWILWIAVLTIAILSSCQGTADGRPISINHISQTGNGLILNVTAPQDESVIRISPVTVSGNTSPDAEVTVNGLAVSLEGTHFSVQVELETGPNSIDVVARDASGKQVSKYLTVVYVP